MRWLAISPKLRNRSNNWRKADVTHEKQPVEGAAQRFETAPAARAPHVNDLGLNRMYIPL